MIFTRYILRLFSVHRFGLKKDEPNPEAAPPKKQNDPAENSEDSSQVLENEYAVLIDSEKSYDEQLKIGRPLFVSLLMTGTVSKTAEEEDRLTKAESSISETLGIMISFQLERQLANARKFLPFKADMLAVFDNFGNGECF